MKFRILSFALFSWMLTAGSFGFATPAQVIIIRHGEKIDDVNPNLSPRGKLRAKALVGFFSTNSDVLSFGPLVAIFATEPKAGGSLRSIQTVTPLAEKLGLAINHDFTKADTLSLVRSIMQNSTYQGRSVLISWVHDSIPNIAKTFGATSAPMTWDSKVFDRVWILRFSDNKVAFKDIPQHLLPGDSPNYFLQENNIKEISP